MLHELSIKIQWQRSSEERRQSHTAACHISSNVSVSDFEAQNILYELLKIIKTRRQGRVENVQPVSTSALDVYSFHVPSTLSTKKPPLQNFLYVSKGVAVQDKKAYGVSRGMAPFILIPDTRRGKSSASRTSGFEPGEKCVRCPINRRPSGQKCRYGSFVERNSCLYHKLNQEPSFSSSWSRYYGD
jgi:hypothetical protein